MTPTFLAPLRSAAALGMLALLSACAGSHGVSSTQEASSYEAAARSSYVAPGPSSDPWGPYIHEASTRYDVPERWIREVMRVESGGRTELYGRPITSGAGAMGLMQVMPATYDELKGRYALGSDPYDPHNSILAGTAYIRELYDLYGSPGFLAAYNGGPGRLDDFLTRDRPLPDETRRYVAKIGPYIADSFPRKRSVAEQYAMNTVPTSIPAGPRYPDPAPTATAAYVPPTPVSVPARPRPIEPAPSGPVEVAYAPSTGSDDAFDPPPGWSPVAANRTAAPATAPLPLPSPAILQAETLPEPPAPAYTPAPVPDVEPPLPHFLTRAPQPRAAERTPERTQVAAIPEPPPYVPSAPPPQAQPRRDQGFRFVQPAMAAPAPIYHGSSGQWAIQVGAFGNEGLAHIAVGNAREQASAALAAAHPAVSSIREPHGTLYRARLTGLSRDAASAACDRLRGRGNCIVLSPEAQN